MNDPQRIFAELQGWLQQQSAVAVAVSGGVDSMTLAVMAHRTLDDRAQMIHAVSPAVPPQATARVQHYSQREGWWLTILNAGEFTDPHYRANPANRCYFCKSNLYGTMAKTTDATLLSGTNTDDLGDYRPGLKAAEQNAVLHPYVDVGIDKQGVRSLARWLELTDLAELPAAPCLSSRVETGIRIEPRILSVINRVEQQLRTELQPRTVRCRVRQDEICIELDEHALSGLSAAQQQQWRERITAIFQPTGVALQIAFRRYHMGSAFIRPDSIHSSS